MNTLAFIKIKGLENTDLLYSALILVVGLLLVFILARQVGKWAKKHQSDHHALVFQKAIFYTGIILVITTVLIQLNVNLTAVLGAAGIATVAIGFAAQTSLSNLISGLFLLSERPFKVGDLILVGTTRGFVLSIDLLSVKIRTLDNLFIRLPNETLIKSEVTTITRYPIRRMDINVGVAYKEDVATVLRVLGEIADKNHYCLDEPAPLILVKDFGTSSIDFLLGAWFEKNNFLNLKNTIMRDIKERFDAEGIDIAFPHLTVYSGARTEPFPIQVTEPTGNPPIEHKTGNADEEI